MQLDNLYKMRRIACPGTCMPVTVNQSYFKETLYKLYGYLTTKFPRFFIFFIIFHFHVKYVDLAWVFM